MGGIGVFVWCVLLMGMWMVWVGRGRFETCPYRVLRRGAGVASPVD